MAICVISLFLGYFSVQANHDIQNIDTERLNDSETVNINTGETIAVAISIAEDTDSIKRKTSNREATPKCLNVLSDVNFNEGESTGLSNIGSDGAKSIPSEEKTCSNIGLSDIAPNPIDCSKVVDGRDVNSSFESQICVTNEHKSESMANDVSSKCADMFLLKIDEKCEKNAFDNLVEVNVEEIHQINPGDENEIIKVSSISDTCESVASLCLSPLLNFQNDRNSDTRDASVPDTQEESIPDTWDESIPDTQEKSFTNCQFTNDASLGESPKTASDTIQPRVFRARVMEIEEGTEEMAANIGSTRMFVSKELSVINGVVTPVDNVIRVGELVIPCRTNCIFLQINSQVQYSLA